MSIAEAAEEVVCNTLLEYYATPAVEKRLAPDALLKEDLALTDVEILLLGLAVESKYQTDERPVFHIPDRDILQWKTVCDIVTTLERLLDTEAG